MLKEKARSRKGKYADVVNDEAAVKLLKFINSYKESENKGIMDRIGS